MPETFAYLCPECVEPMAAYGLPGRTRWRCPSCNWECSADTARKHLEYAGDQTAPAPDAPLVFEAQVRKRRVTAQDKERATAKRQARKAGGF